MEANNLYRFLMEKVRTTHEFSTLMQADMDAAKNAPKFMLPEGANILNAGLKGLPPVLKLPYPITILEYDYWVHIETMQDIYSSRQFKPRTVKDGWMLQKEMVIATQLEDKIEIRMIALVRGVTEDDDVIQSPGYTVFIPCEWEGNLEDLMNRFEKNDARMDFNYAKFEGNIKEFMKTPNHEETLHGLGKIAYLQPITAVLSLIEALSCRNVGHEALPTRKLNKSAAKRGVLPFDEYRVLTVTASKGNGGNKGGIVNDRHSPREHLRRGHIRTYESGLKIWVQSTVVNAGAGQTLSKDYKVK